MEYLFSKLELLDEYLMPLYHQKNIMNLKANIHFQMLAIF